LMGCNNDLNEALAYMCSDQVWYERQSTYFMAAETTARMTKRVGIDKLKQRYINHDFDGWLMDLKRVGMYNYYLEGIMEAVDLEQKIME